MFTMILISTTAILVGIVGCVVIWGLDALRADEIEQTRPAPAPAPAPALPAVGETRAIDRS